MTRTEIEEKVRAFLIDDLEIDEDKIFDDAKLKEDMGIDCPEEMTGVTTLSQFCDYIESKVG